MPAAILPAHRRRLRPGAPVERRRMTPDIESLYPRIGQTLVDVAGGPIALAHVHVEMADDVGSIGVFVDRGSGTYDYLTDDDGGLFDLFTELRQRHIDAGLGAWSQATFSLRDGGRFSIDYGHADVSDFGKGADRRADWMSRVLGPDAQVRWTGP
jgi:Protein of unknown function, DUF600